MNNEEVETEPVENNVFDTIRRQNIDGPEDAKVAVFPTHRSGLTFLKENNAWGFVNVGQKFNYVAMYFSGDIREVRYFATVRDVVELEDADLAREPTDYLDRDWISNNKMIVRFETNSLYRIEDPVPYETKYPQSLQYTKLGDVKKAETTDDML